LSDASAAVANPERRAIAMLKIVRRSPNGNGGLDPILGRGLARRRLSRTAAVARAADVACGEVPFVPSLKQLATLFDVPVRHLREELKQRAAWNGLDPGLEALLAEVEADAEAEAKAQALVETQEEAERVHDDAMHIVHALERATPVARNAAFRMYGVGNVWDEIYAIVG
jgi:hypothetical protein